MKYEIIKIYEYTETTCGELVEKLHESNGDRYCVDSTFVDPTYPDETFYIFESWDWIQARQKSKKIYLVDEISSIGRIIKDDDQGEVTASNTYICPNCNKNGIPSIFGNQCTSCSNVQRFSAKWNAISTVRRPA